MLQRVRAGKRFLGVLAIGVSTEDGLLPCRFFPSIGLSDRPSDPLPSVTIGNPASLLDRFGGVKIASESRLRIYISLNSYAMLRESIGRMEGSEIYGGHTIQVNGA